MIDCRYHMPLEHVLIGGRCTLGKHGGTPSFGVCRLCIRHGQNVSQGAGDMVAHAIQKLSRGKVKPCGGCKKRQAALNKLLPSKG